MAKKMPPDPTPGQRQADSPAGVDSSVELLLRAREGEGEALDRLLRRYRPAFRAWARRRLPQWARDAVDTEDVVQETLIHAVQRLPEFEPRGDGALQAYLHQALRNRIRDELRRAQRRGQPTTLPSQEPTRSPSPLQHVIGAETFERYHRALDRLEPHEREAIVARVELRQSWAEVAAALGKPSADAARMAVSRALKRLAEEMARDA